MVVQPSSWLVSSLSHSWWCFFYISTDVLQECGKAFSPSTSSIVLLATRKKQRDAKKSYIHRHQQIQHVKNLGGWCVGGDIFLLRLAAARPPRQGRTKRRGFFLMDTSRTFSPRLVGTREQTRVPCMLFLLIFRLIITRNFASTSAKKQVDLIPPPHEDPHHSTRGMF